MMVMKEIGVENGGGGDEAGVEGGSVKREGLVALVTLSTLSLYITSTPS